MSPSTDQGTAMGDENDPVVVVHQYIDALRHGRGRKAFEPQMRSVDRDLQ